MNKRPHIFDLLSKFLFLILVCELANGGGGRLLAFGPVTLRMVLFGCALIVTVAGLYYGEKIGKGYVKLLVAFCIVMALGMTMGLLNGAPRQLWWEDVKPLLYFLILPFFVMMLNTENIYLVSQIYKYSAILLAATFLLLLSLIHTGTLPFLDFYQPAVNSTEFYFRGEYTFFFKGFLYLCIGFIFIDFTQHKYRQLLLAFIFCAILLTLTRGFLLALLLSYAVYYFLQARWTGFIVAIAFALLVLVAGKNMIEFASRALSNFKSTNISSVKRVAVLDGFQYSPSTIEIAAHTQTDQNPNAVLLGDREYSDAGRWQQIREVAERISPLSLMVGHGFGIGIPSRPVHLEISYAEILHKQGVAGLIFWACILVLLYRHYRAAPSNPLRDAFFISGIFVFFQSMTNQFVNNPIGLSMVLIAVIALEKIKST
jgi:hypothetical protein